MRESPATVIGIDGDGAHQTTAGGPTVAGMDIDVLAGEADGAVVRVAIADVERAASFAVEVFNAPLKSAGGFVEVGHRGIIALERIKRDGARSRTFAA